MIRDKLTGAILYINNPLCKASEQNIATMVPKGAVLTIVVVKDGKADGDPKVISGTGPKK